MQFLAVNLKGGSFWRDSLQCREYMLVLSEGNAGQLRIWPPQMGHCLTVTGLDPAGNTL